MATAKSKSHELSTEEKNVSRVASSEPTTPALLNTLMRPLTPTRNCVGPTAPIESGGTNPESPNVAPVKLVPMMVTEAPTGPLAGEKEVIPGFTVKLPELVAVPTVLVTLMGPLVAPGGTMALS